MAGGISVSSVSQRQQSQTSRTFEAKIIGVEGLDDTDGEAVVQQAVRRGQRVRARERLCLAAPAVECNALCEDRKAGDGDGARSADGRIAEDAVVERQVDRIVPALIGQRLDLHAREQQLGAAGLGAGGAVERRLRLAGEIDAQILHAVLIHAAVQNLIGMNADTCIAGLLKGFVWAYDNLPEESGQYRSIQQEHSAKAEGELCGAASVKSGVQPCRPAFTP